MQKHNTIAALLTLAGVIVAALLVIRGFGLLAAIISFIAVYAIVGLTMSVFMRLERCERT